MKKHELTLFEAIFLLIAGAFLGTVFTFGMQYWNAGVTPEDCQVVQTRFAGYHAVRQVKNPGSITQVAMDCGNGKRHFIDGSCVSADLLEALDALARGEEITLRLHPNTNTVTELTAGDKVLLNFDQTMGKLETEANGFFFLGLLLYACAIAGLVAIIRHYFRK